MSLSETLPFRLEGRRVLLVGGAGFIGHNLAITLKRLGADVEVVDALLVNNLVSTLTTNQAGDRRTFYGGLLLDRLSLLERTNIPVRGVDARDYHAVCAVMNEFQPDTVVHLAAVAHANRANKDPHQTFDHSLRTLENVLDASKAINAHVVYFSSSMVYGNFTSGMVAENTPCEPIGIYGALKFSGEKIVIAYNQVFDLPYTIIRPSALYGERCISRRVGQVFIENAIEGLEIKIQGDGSDRLDFTYIQDLVQGIVRCIAKPEAKNEVFNITYGASRTIQEMAEILRQHFPQIKLTYESRDRLMPHRGTLSVEKARSMLGYEPEYPLERGFVSYIEWYKSLDALATA